MVARGLLEQRAMLLVTSWVQQLNTLKDFDMGTPRLLLSFLIKALHPHLGCNFKQPSTGTMLYRKDGDLLMTISKLLRSKKGSSS